MDKTLSQLLREEEDRLKFRIRCSWMKGKVFSFKEAVELGRERQKELDALEKAENETHETKR